MIFSDKIQEDLNRVDFAASGKEDALRQIAGIAATTPELKPFGAEALYASLSEREAAVSTGLGGGIAIPHARLQGIEDFIIFVLVAPKGIEFEALDNRKVRIFVVVFAPEGQVSEHLKILATISRAMSQGNLKKELLQVESPEVLSEVLGRATEDGGNGIGKSTLPGPRKLLLIILYYEEDLRAVLEYLIDQGIEGATIVDSKGMGAYVSAIPLFAGFLGFMREDRNTSSTVLTLVSAAHEKAIAEGIERITGDLDKKQGAMIISLDVSFSKGTMSMI